MVAESRRGLRVAQGAQCRGLVHHGQRQVAGEFAPAPYVNQAFVDLGCPVVQCHCRLVVAPSAHGDGFVHVGRSQSVSQVTPTLMLDKAFPDLDRAVVGPDRTWRIVQKAMQKALID